MKETIRALYAQDNLSDADRTKSRFLTLAPDIDLDIVRTGGECLARVRNGYDVLLVDDQLPDRSGVDVMRELTADDVPVPFVFVTATGDEDLAVRTLRLGAWDYVLKSGNYVDTLPDVLRSVVAEHRRLRAIGSVTSRPRRRIVYAEHSSADIDLTARHFAEAAPNLNLEVVRSTQEALARLQQGELDLLLIDLRLPDVGAVEILRTVRRHQFRVPVIVITGRGDETAAIASLKLGASDYIVKRDNYLAQLPYAIENAIHRAQLLEANLRLEAELAERERSEAESVRLLAEVESQRKRLDETVANVPGMVWESWGRTGDPDYRLTFMSRHAERMLGYSAEEWLSTPSLWHTVVHPEDRERAAAENARAYASGEGGTIQLRLVARDGRTVWAVVRTSVIMNEAGQPVGIRGVTTDVTASKEAEAHRAHLEEQLILSQKLESLGRLAGGVAHDFNNLLTAINGYADLIRLDLAPSHPWAADLMEIRTAGERAASLTRQLLAFSRRQLLQPRVLDLNQLVGATTRLLTRVLGEDVELITELDPELGEVKADPGQIDQVIMNLAVNARDAMPRGGTLTLQTHNIMLDEVYSLGHFSLPPGSYVQLTVSDTGEGMDAETVPHIFEPFFTTKEAGKGTGLGLSTVYGIVKQSGGWIWAYSEPGHGTTFKIYLPRVDEPAAEAEAPVLLDERPRGSETVLVVEDDALVRRLMIQALTKSGYVVIEAPDAREAIRIASEHRGPIPLMITDVVMPLMSGRELAERFAVSRPDMRVLYISGYTDDSVVRHGLLDSSMHFLQKPFTPNVLARKVREVLDK